MKHLFILALVILGITFAGCNPTKVDNSRDYTYESYCDSIWENDPEFYSDVLVETDEYISYVESHGEWWNK